MLRFLDKGAVIDKPGQYQTYRIRATEATDAAMAGRRGSRSFWSRKVRW
jgi:hypothetical protein